jgi:hypothetical protein
MQRPQAPAWQASPWEHRPSSSAPCAVPMRLSRIGHNIKDEPYAKQRALLGVFSSRYSSVSRDIRSVGPFWIVLPLVRRDGVSHSSVPVPVLKYALVHSSTGTGTCSNMYTFESSCYNPKCRNFAVHNSVNLRIFKNFLGRPSPKPETN